ncbi:MAG TPA: hypothetical protein DDY71_15890 [Spirochaetia bacterium]|nr:MAG: hypothetical protein A2Y30_00105 [Spirochaetes bacterium GWE1_32_154]HBD92632.1 hypothetical protein [Spirochaetia bacterium]HBI39123.1 hypothetical protein [Spirochaetia bacterium]
MKRLMTILFVVISLSGCKSAVKTKEPQKSAEETQYDIAWNNDIKWKKYVAGIQQEFNETKSAETGFKLWSRFESFNPFTGNFQYTKDKITTKHKIEKYEYVQIPTRDGLKLDGWFIPVENAKGTIIVLHGWGSDIDFGLTQSKFLVSLGYQILVYNARYWNFADNPYDYVGFIANDIEDIGDVITFISARVDVNTDKLGVMGFSYGAEKSIIAGAKYKQLKFVMADAAPINDEPYTEKQFTYIKSLFKGKSVPSITMAELDILNAAATISPRPLMLLHGEKDNSVPLEHSKIILEKAKEPKEMHTFPASGHCLGMMGSDKEAYFKVVNDFLEKNVNKK